MIHKSIKLRFNDSFSGVIYPSQDIVIVCQLTASKFSIVSQDLVESKLMILNMKYNVIKNCKKILQVNIFNPFLSEFFFVKIP